MAKKSKLTPAHKKKSTHPKKRSKKPQARKLSQKASPAIQNSTLLNSLLQSPQKSIYMLLGMVLLLAGVILWNYLTLNNVLIFSDVTSSDTLNIFFPQWYQKIDYIHQNGIPKWSFHAGLGVNHYPKGLSFDPINWIDILLGTKGLAYRIVYIQLAYLILTAIFTFLYFQTIAVNRYVAILAALMMAFSGYAMLGLCWYGHLKGICFTILLLLAFEQLFIKDRWWIFPLAVMFFVGPKLYFNVVFLALYSLFRFVSTKTWDPVALGKLWLRMAALGLLGILLAAPFWGAEIYSLLNSSRVTGEAAKINELTAKPIFFIEEARHYVTVILRLFSNDLLGTASAYKGWYNYLEAPAFYCGLLSLLLVPQAFLFLSKKARIALGVFLGFWVLLIIFPFFRYTFYLYAGDFYKHALSFFVPFSLLFVAAQSLHHMYQGGKLHIPILLGTFALLEILLFFPYESVNGSIQGGVQAFTGVMLVLYTLCLLAWQLRPAIRHQLLLGLTALVLLDLGFNGYISLNDRDAISGKVFYSNNGYFDSSLDAIAYLKASDPSFFRTSKRYSSSPAVNKGFNDAMIQGYYGSAIYASQNNKHYLQFLKETGMVDVIDKQNAKWVAGVEYNVFLQGIISSKYTLRKAAKDKVNFTKDLFEPLQNFEDVEVYKNRCYIPFGFTYDSYMLLNNYRKIDSKSKKAALLYQSAVVEQDVVERLNSMKERRAFTQKQITFNKISDQIKQRSKHGLQISSFEQSNIQGKASLAKPQLMFFSIPYHKGWKAVVNGQEAELLRVNIGFMGLMLEAGEHEIELSYTPYYYREGWMVFLIALAAFGFLLWRNYGRKKDNTL